MKPRIKKIILKIGMMYPLIFLKVFIGFSINEVSLIPILIISLVISIIVIAFNAFDYDFYDDMDDKDYFESKHVFFLPYSAELWSRIELLDQDEFGLSNPIESGSVLRYNVNRTVISSVLEFDRKGEEIEMTIKGGLLNIYPDKARNYKSARRILHALGWKPSNMKTE